MTTKVTSAMTEDAIAKKSGVVVLNQPIASTIPVLLDAEFDFKITSLIVESGTGTIDLDLTVEGGAASATYTDITISTTKTEYTADENVDAGESVELVFTSPSSPGLITIQINWEAR